MDRSTWDSAAKCIIASENVSQGPYLNQTYHEYLPAQMHNWDDLQR